MLVGSGADVNIRSKNSEGASALYYAAGNGFEDVVERLLFHGARVNEGQRRVRESE
jgi:ankyrin repeat protein